MGDAHARLRLYARTVMQARVYEIHLRGRLSPAVRASFGELASSEKPAETVLHGPIRDDAELYATLNRIQSLGLELVELRRVPEAPQSARSGAAEHPEGISSER